jgi:hypothetical protein
MKKHVLAAFVVLLTVACSSTVTKNFKVFVDPPDSVISVVSGPDLKELKYHSPASLTVEVPKYPALARKAVLEVRRDDYKPRIIALRDIAEGSTLNIKLEKVVQHQFRYRLSYRLITPTATDSLQYQDNSIAISIYIVNESCQIRLENLTSNDIKIVWERSQYIDQHMQPHRLMHSGIRFQDRNNPIPDQIVHAHVSIQEAVFPVDHVIFISQKKSYDIEPLFPLDRDEAAQLKGRAISLFIPIEVNRAIIPYNFKIEIVDAVKEPIKG